MNLIKYIKITNEFNKNKDKWKNQIINYFFI